jgi:hypothetical protein
MLSDNRDIFFTWEGPFLSERVPIDTIIKHRCQVVSTLAQCSGGLVFKARSEEQFT